MSAWGKRDRIEVSVTAKANLLSNVITTNGPVVTAANGFVVGYSLTIANVDYAIQTISSANTIILDTTYRGANTNAANIAIQEDPKWIRTNGRGTTMNSGRGPNTVNKANVYGVDRVEANVPANKANGFSQPGWTSYKTYTTTQGAIRNKVEVLVAMSKNFNANATGVLNLTDANDNNILRNS
jgi:hypothetical protein